MPTKIDKPMKGNDAVQDTLFAADAALITAVLPGTKGYAEEYAHIRQANTQLSEQSAMLAASGALPRLTIGGKDVALADQRFNAQVAQAT